MTQPPYNDKYFSIFVQRNNSNYGNNFQQIVPD